MSTAANLEAMFDVRRDTWDPGDDDRDRPPERVWSYIVAAEIHHLGDNRTHRIGSAVEELSRAERYHENILGWRDLFYNVGVDPHNGDIYEGRLWGLPSQADLMDTLTVLIIGDGRHDQLHPSAVTSLHRIAGLFSQPLRLHRDRDFTLCPSDAYSDAVAQINKQRSTDDEVEGMETLIDSSTGQHWVAASGKARILTDPDDWMSSWVGPVRSSQNMRFVIGDLYELG